MTPLYRDPGYTFRFADRRLIGRVHLAGVAAGTPVTLADLRTGGRLAEAVAGADGWVPLDPPLVVEPGGGFVASPTKAGRPAVSHPDTPSPRTTDEHSG